MSLLSIVAIGGFGPASATSPHFYPDDPIARAPEPQNASVAAFSEIDMLYELTYNPFALPWAQALGRARAEHQHHRRGPRLQLVHQPCSGTRPRSPSTRSCAVRTSAKPPDPSRWVIFREKSAGGSTRYHRPRMPKGETWFSRVRLRRTTLKAATSPAVVMSTKFFWAARLQRGPSLFLTTFDPEATWRSHPEADVPAAPNGKRTPAHPAPRPSKSCSNVPARNHQMAPIELSRVA